MESCNIANTPCPGHATGAAGMLFAQLIQTLIAAQCGISHPAQYPDDIGHNLKDGDTYDFIVVGAGSAGSVLANRLSEVEKWKVLLIEAGGDPSITSEIPGLLFGLQGTEMDWGYGAEGDNICQGIREKKCYWPRGKGLGGTSSINANLYIRGNRGDYDNWKNLGNPGWGFEDVLPYFKKSEDMVDPQMDGDKLHGQGGLLTVGKFGFDHPLKSIFVAAGMEMGYKELADMNGKEPFGFGESHGTIRDGKRCSTAKAFLTPAKHRKNLFVTKHSLVTRVIVDKDSKKATGVEIKRDGKIIKLKATKEVIVSAGAINSPQILMLSGIGPKQHLTDLGIEPIVDLPVGFNLQDHMAMPIPFQINKGKSYAIPPMFMLDEIYKYLTKSAGIFATIATTDMTAFIKTLPNLKYPDIQFHYISFTVNDTALLDIYTQATKFGPASVEHLKRLNSQSDVLMYLPTLLQPKSTGRILLRTKNPEDSPIINAGYMTEEVDIDTMLRSIDFVRRMGDTQAMRSIDAEMVPLQVENCGQHELGTHDYWRCAMRQVSTTMYHPTSTCKMGPATDKGAVVDSKLKVHGVKNLRVVDASVMPNIVSGNTNAPTIMIGEKAADMIKATYKITVRDDL